MPNDPCRPDKEEIAREILAYLADHPDAQDTVEGIIDWWLTERCVRFESTRVLKTLNDLVSKGKLVRVHHSDSITYYQLNKTDNDAD